jgi:hypothetical protein
MTARILGGMFGLAEGLSSPPPAVPDFLAWTDALFLANARSGLRVLVDRLSPPRVFLPSYLCDSLLTALRETRTEVVFYEVDGALSPRAADLEAVREGDLVVAIAYFGFPAAEDVGRAARRAGAWLLEDKSQALLTAASDLEADFVLYSPRKFVGVPDGGILASRCAVRLGDVPLLAAPAAWWRAALAAATQRADYDRQGGERGWFDLFREAERLSPVGACAMSGLSRHLLSTAFDYGEIARRRVLNYRCLARRLGSAALLPDLPDDVVPLGFPVRLADREGVRRHLVGHGIYPPVHWELAPHVPPAFAESHALSAAILTLPCDQRAGEGEMERMAGLVHERSAAAGLPA